MTIDEAIKHCLEVAEENEELSSKFDEWDEWEEADANNCRECAADHRQLAEWLTELKELESKHWDECRQIAHYDDELKEAKRLLKAAVDDFKEINSNILTCKYCRWYSVEIDECTYYPDDVPCKQICGWKHEAEALKLIGGSENE